MLVYLVLIHIQYYTPIHVCQSTWHYYTYNTIHQYLYVSLPGNTKHTILYTNTCMLVYMVLLHIQYYIPIPVCQSTWYYYTNNTKHQYLYVSLPGITTHTILYTNTCMLLYLVLLYIVHTIIYTYTCMSVYQVLLHIQYYTPIHVC